MLRSISSRLLRTVSSRRLFPKIHTVTSTTPTSRGTPTTSSPSSTSSICAISHFQQRSFSSRACTDGFYNHAVNETLESLSDKISELIDDNTNEELEGADITLSDGVLTVNLGHKHGIYVINKQTPNKQVWMSSPQSGPMRFDLVAGSSDKSDTWIYSHTGQSLHQVLDQELGAVFKIETNFQQDCFMGGAIES